jgi:hypothetical protein
MSCKGSPARSTIALPSPVQVCAEVHEKYARPYPPVARITMWARKRWIEPSSRFHAMTPRQTPSESMIRSSAKYSTKNSALLRSDCWYSVWMIAWPVRSAAAQARLAGAPSPYSIMWPPNGR